MVSRLTREIAFYRKYHRNPVNVGLHIVFIPIILFTSLYNASSVKFPGSTYLSLGSVTSFYYWFYYARFDHKFGTLVGGVLAAASLWFSKLTTQPNTHHRLAWTLWATGWIAQFIGHGRFEGLAPALFDNLQQALVLAPYFAFLEVAAHFGLKHAQDEINKVDLVPDEFSKITKTL